MSCTNFPNTVIVHAPENEIVWELSKDTVRPSPECRVPKIHQPYCLSDLVKIINLK